MHHYALGQTGLSTITLVVMLLGYHRIFHGSPDGFELAMLGIEAALIGGSVVLLPHHRGESDFVPIQLASRA